MAHTFEIIDSQPRSSLAVREMVPATEFAARIGQALGAVMQHLGRLGEAPTGMPFIGYLSMGPIFDTVIGFPTPHELPGDGAVTPITIPGGRRAVTMHKGPYEQLADTYGELIAWVAQQGEKPAGPWYEYYFNAPNEVPPSELLTRMELLLA